MANLSKLGHTDLAGAVAGGVVATIGFFGLALGVGQIGSFEAMRLIEAMQPGLRFLAAAVVGASITVLALLLTLLGLTLRSDFSFHPRLYKRTGRITTTAVLGLIVAVAMLLAGGVPIVEVDSLRAHVTWVYYSLAAGMAILGGLVVAISLMIGATLRGLIDIGIPDASSHLLDDDADVGLDEAQAREPAASAQR